MTFWVLFLIVLVAAVVSFWIQKKHEGFYSVGKHVLLTPLETKNFLLADADGYIASLSASDLAVRGFSNNNEYLDFLKTAEYVECPNMDNAISDANMLIDRFNDVEDGWLQKAKLKTLPWIIAVSPLGYEFDLPHTRGQVIMLPLSFFGGVSSDNSDKGSDKGASLRSDGGASLRSDTLVHEKLHVYQKTYPKDFEAYLFKEGFTICKRRFNRSSNPDADKQVYERNGEPWYGYYASLNSGKGASLRSGAGFGAGSGDGASLRSGNGFQSIRYTPVNNPRYDCPREYAVYTLLDKFS